MIHNTYLVRIQPKKILANSQYWPIDVPEEEVLEFIDSRDEIRQASGSDFVELPLLVGDHKYMGFEVMSGIIIVLVSDKNEDERVISDKAKSAGSVVMKAVNKKGLDYVIQNYAVLIEDALITKLKIALVGEGGVGKTTTLHLLLGDTPPLQYVPTIALNLETVENIRFGNYSLVLWDFAGQERFRNLWRFYFHGADVIFLVCDSSLRNVIVSKDILKLIRRDAPKVPLFAIANKQDKPKAMKPEVIQKILGIPTYPMVAIDKSRRDEMLRILMNAAAEYVGVTVPDLPVSELVRFADEATEQLEAMDDEIEPEEEYVEEDEEGIDVDEDYEEEYEVVYVDEDGHVIEDLDEYEIVEEEEELVEVDTTVSGEAEAIDEPVTPPQETSEITTPPEEDEGPGVDEHEVVEEVEEEVIEVSVASSEEFLVVEEGDEVVEVDTAVQEEVEIVDEPVISPEETSEITTPRDVDDGSDLAKEIIVEALGADEILTEEISRATKEELDEALDAFKSDEVLPTKDEEEEVHRHLADHEKEDLEGVLGGITDKDESEEKDQSDLSVDDAIIAEFDRIIGRVSVRNIDFYRDSRSEEDEDEDKSED